MNCFVPAKGTHQVAYGLEGVWSLTSVSSTDVDGSGVVDSNQIIGSFHRLRLGFIFDEFRTLLTVCS